MRANAAQRAQRLNHSRSLLQRCRSLADAVQQLAEICSISPRQAYRYVKQAQSLKGPVPVPSPKIAFTVKLPSAQVRQLRLYAAHTGLTLSDIVSRAVSNLIEFVQSTETGQAQIGHLDLMIDDLAQSVPEINGSAALAKSALQDVTPS